MLLLRLPLGKTYASLSQLLGNSASKSIVQFSVAKLSTTRFNFSESIDDSKKAGQLNYRPPVPVNKDRSVKVDVATSIRYLKSDAYKQTYGDHLIWQLYRRNHKGMYAPKKTRLACIVDNRIKGNNPCPICRDENLVVHYTNLELLKQFIDKYSGEKLNYETTGLCQEANLQVMLALDHAYDRGLIELPVPFRKYNYKEFYPWLLDREPKQ